MEDGGLNNKLHFCFGHTNAYVSMQHDRPGLRAVAAPIRLFGYLSDLGLGIEGLGGLGERRDDRRLARISRVA